MANFFDQFDGDDTVEASNIDGVEPTAVERFTGNMRDSIRQSPTPALGKLNELYAAPEGPRRDAIRQKQEREELDYSQMKASDTAFEFFVATAGQLAGGATDPANYLYTPIRLGSAAFRLGRPLLSTVLDRAVGTAVVNVGLDSAAQGFRIATGVQTEFSTARAAIAAGIGATLGTGTGVLKHKADLRKKRLDELDNLFDEFDGNPETTAAEVATISEGFKEGLEGAQKVSKEKAPDLTELTDLTPKLDRFNAAAEAVRNYKGNKLNLGDGTDDPVFRALLEDKVAAEKELIDTARKTGLPGAEEGAPINSVDDVLSAFDAATPAQKRAFAGPKETLDDVREPRLKVTPARTPEKIAADAKPTSRVPELEAKIKDLEAKGERIEANKVRNELLRVKDAEAVTVIDEALPNRVHPKTATPQARIQVRQNLDDTFDVSMDYSIGNGGSGTPFHGGHATAKEALEAGIANVRNGAQHQVDEAVRNLSGRSTAVTEAKAVLKFLDDKFGGEKATVKSLISQRNKLVRSGELTDVDRLDVKRLDDEIEALGGKRPRPIPEQKDAALEGDQGFAPDEQPRKRRAANSQERRGAVAEDTAPLAARLEDIVVRLMDAVSNPVAFRQGRINSRKAIGIHKRPSGVIRVLDVTDIQTVAHEIGHNHEASFGKALAKLKKAHKAELEPLHYPGTPKGKELSEGFAEFIRFFATNEARARKLAPKFFDEYSNFLRKHDPAILEVFEEVREAHKLWRQTPSGAAIKTDIVSSKPEKLLGSKNAKAAQQEFEKHGFKNTLQAWADELYMRFIDDLHPINVAVRELLEVHRLNKGTDRTLLAVDDAYKRQRLSVDASQRGMVDQAHGVVPYGEVSPVGSSLYAAIEKAVGKKMGGKWNPGLMDDFAAYLVSRRAVVEWKRFDDGLIPNEPTKLPPADYQQALRELDSPEFQEGARMLYEYQDNLLEKMHAAGLIDDANVAAFRERPDYVPFLRDMKDFGEEVGLRGVTADRASPTGKLAVVQSFRGSQRSIINPLESIMKHTIDLNQIISRNDTFKALADLAESAGVGSGTIIERIPNTKINARQIGVDEVMEAAARENGVDSRDVEALREMTDALFGEDGSGTIFRAGEAPEKGEPIIYIWRNGSRQAYRLADGRFGKQLYQSLTMLGREQTDMLTDIFAYGATAVRTGVTTSPDFMVANFVRDQVSAWILSDDFSFVPGLSGARGLADEFTGGEMSRLHATAGGLAGGQNTAALHEIRINNDLNKLHANGYSIERVKSVKGIMKALELSETGTRIGLFSAAFKKARKNGLSEYEAMMEAGFSSRDYIDFGRHGSNMLHARRLVPFLNASIQGLDKGFRQLIFPFIQHANAGLGGKAVGKAQGKRLAQAMKSWVKVATVGMAGLGLSAIYRDDEEFEEIPQYYRHTHWMIKKGAGDWIAVPKPFEFAILSNVFERAFEAAYKNDPLAWERLREGMGEILVPPASAPSIKVPFEIAANRDFFFDKPIVGERLQKFNADPHLQWDAYTSELGKIMGKATNTSPKYWDHAITGFGASWGRQILNWSNMASKDAPASDLTDSFITRRFVKFAARGSTSSRQFWKEMARNGGQFTGAAEGYKSFLKAGRPGEADAFLAGKDENQKSFAILDATFKASQKRLHPLKRAKDATLAISKVRREIREGIMPIKMTPSRRLAVDRSLSYLSMVEHRNALVYTGVTGWKQKKPMDTQDVWDELKAASPEIHDELKARYKKAKVYSEKGVAKFWPEAQQRLLKEGKDARLDDLVADARFN